MPLTKRDILPLSMAGLVLVSAGWTTYLFLVLGIGMVLEPHPPLGRLGQAALPMTPPMLRQEDDSGATWSARADTCGQRRLPVQASPSQLNRLARWWTS